MSSFFRKGLAVSLGFDPRCLAVFRMAVGLVVLADLADRARDLSAHYTDQGVVPRADLLAQGAVPPEVFSLFLWGGSKPFVASLFLLTAAAAGALALGYRTRLAAFLTWLMVYSLQWRNPPVLGAGDAELRLLLFWGLFLPWGQTWSLDAGSRSEGGQVLSLATVALRLQIFAIYLFSGLMKSDPAWRDGTALGIAFQADPYVTPMGQALLEHPDLLARLSNLVVPLQVGCALLLLFPWRPIQALAALALAGLDLGLGLSLSLGVYPLIAIAGLLPFCPPVLWQRLHFGRPFRRWDGRKPASSFVSPAVGAVLTFLMVYCAAWNLGNLPEPLVRVPDPLRRLGMVLGLNQRWAMLAPAPPHDGGWHVVAATTRAGARLDLLRNGQPLTWEKPALPSALYPNARWHMLLWNVCQRDNFPGLRRPLAAFYCRDWNAAHGRLEDHLVEVELDFMLEATPRPNLPRDEQPVQPEAVRLQLERYQARGQ